MKEKDPEILEAIDNIFNTIESLRISAGLSINALATEAEISENTLKSILKKESGPSIGTLIRLCRCFDLSLWRFFLIAEGETKYGHQKSRDMLDAFEALQPRNKDLLIYIAKNLGK